MNRLSRVASTVAVMTLVTSAAAQVPVVPLDDDGFDDGRMQYAIERELTTDPTGPFPRVEVAVEAGVVTLTGVVRHLHARERAVEIAGDVRGVRAVIDRLAVAAGSRDDAEIAGDVRAALEGSVPSVRGLSVEVESGRVVLEGTVASWGERRLATMLAGRVPGVEHVESAVGIEPQEERDDDTLRRVVAEALEWDRRLDGARLDVAAADGVVSLTGEVRSVVQREHAETLAWLSGARVVETSDVVVRPARATDRASRSRPVDDRQIEAAVEAAVRRDPRVLPEEFEPTAAEGVVTLRGLVATPQAALRVEQNARNTHGVIDVRNELEVRPSGPMLANDALQRRVAAALQRNPYVHRFEVDLTVEEGRVTLRGAVDTTFERRQAAASASDVAGVTDVVNLLEVRRPDRPYVRPQELDALYALEGELDERPRVMASLEATDAEIREAIVDELRWSPFVDVEQVTVSVEGGIATLRGSVASERARQRAEENAWEGGAVHVVNRVDVTESASSRP